MAASALKLQVQTKEESVKPVFGRQNNIMWPAPTALNLGDSFEWTRPWIFGHMEQRWLSQLAPWGQGSEVGLLCIPGITAGCPSKVTVAYPQSPEGARILPGTFVLSLKPVHAPLVLLCVDTSGTPMGKEVKVWYTRPGRDLPPVTVLSEGHSLACILFDGPYLPLLVALKHVCCHP